MKIINRLVILLILVFVIHCDGQTVTDDSNAASPSFAEIDFDNIWSREKLTGDWGGARTDLLNHGIDIGLRLTQYYQGVASGGRNTNFAYGGKFDIWLNLDGHKAGLWEDFFLHVRAENQFGESILSDAGSLALPNSTMLYPKATAGYRDMAVTQLLGKQFLSKNFAVVLSVAMPLGTSRPMGESVHPGRGSDCVYGRCQSPGWRAGLRPQQLDNDDGHSGAVRRRRRGCRVLEVLLRRKQKAG